MKFAGIEVPVKNAPPLDPGFLPILKFNRAFLATAKKPVDIAVERASGQMAVCHTFIHDTPEMAEADQSDYLVLTAMQEEIADFQDQIEALELEWLEAAEKLGE